MHLLPANTLSGKSLKIDHGQEALNLNDTVNIDGKLFTVSDISEEGYVRLVFGQEVMHLDHQDIIGKYNIDSSNRLYRTLP